MCQSGRAAGAWHRHRVGRHREWKLRGYPCSPALWALDPQRPAERLDAVGEAPQAAARLGIGPAATVVGDLDSDRASPRTAMVTSAAVACAYLVTLVSASAIT